MILLHKDGDKSIASNYRPISLRHMILNILDRWIQMKIKTHFNSNDAYQQQQYGFTPQKSTAE